MSNPSLPVTQLSIDHILNYINVSNDPNNPKCARCHVKKPKTEFETINPPRKQIGNRQQETDNIPILLKLCRTCKQKKKAVTNAARTRKREAAKALLGTWLSWEEL